MKNKTLIAILSLFGLIGLIMLVVAAYSYSSASYFDNTDAFVMLFFMGLVFFLIGFIPLLLSIRKGSRKKELLQTGRQIDAKITSIDYNTSLQVNGRSPFVILCQWQDPLNTNQLYLFKSDNIWFDPNNFINSDTIVVYIDENNPKRYYVDLSFLPKIN